VRQSGAEPARGDRVIAGIILAAGRSSRLGRPKQLLPLHGEPLIRHTIGRVLASSLDQVILVVGHEAEQVRDVVADLPVETVHNPDAAAGQSTSVRAGLAALSPDVEAAIFILGDQPGIDPKVIDALIAAWRESRSPVVVPRYEDRMGNPVLFDRRVFPELAALDGDSGARPVVRAYHDSGALHAVLVAGPAPPDVDTEADYAALIATMSPQRESVPPLPLSRERGLGGEGQATGSEGEGKAPGPEG
jgi:molybdenum cofactor cytidylyltransferase